MGEINSAGPGRPEISMYFFVRPNALSATQLNTVWMSERRRNTKREKNKNWSEVDMPFTWMGSNESGLQSMVYGVRCCMLYWIISRTYSCRNPMFGNFVWQACICHLLTASNDDRWDRVEMNFDTTSSALHANFASEEMPGKKIEKRRIKAKRKIKSNGWNHWIEFCRLDDFEKRFQSAPYRRERDTRTHTHTHGR